MCLSCANALNNAVGGMRWFGVINGGGGGADEVDERAYWMIVVNSRYNVSKCFFTLFFSDNYLFRFILCNFFFNCIFKDVNL